MKNKIVKDIAIVILVTLLLMIFIPLVSDYERWSLIFFALLIFILALIALSKNPIQKYFKEHYKNINHHIAYTSAILTFVLALVFNSIIEASGERVEMHLGIPITFFTIHVAPWSNALNFSNFTINPIAFIANSTLMYIALWSLYKLLCLVRK